MKLFENIAPLNSLILVMDRTIGEIPDPDRIGVSLVTATPSCLSIGTLCSVDGDTTVTLSDNESEIGNNLINVYDGVLKTPNKLLSVCTVQDEPVLGIEGTGFSYSCSSLGE